MLKENVEKILKEIEKGNNLGEKITLVAATKTVSAEIINQAVEYGIKVVAENRVQEFREKNESVSKRATQHFIGHLQTNKVKYLVGKVSLIHSVDSIKLAEEISAQSVKRNTVSNILVEVNIGGELSKSGVTPENAFDTVKTIASLSGINVLGLMAMLPKTDDEQLKKKLCLQMREIFDTIKKRTDLPFTYLSMGMSADYKTAIQNGSNMIRLGSVIFGARS